MKKIINNPSNINNKYINKVTNKVRAIIIDDNNIIVTKYADMYMLPGGKVNKNEFSIDALKRELHEEIGIDLNEKYLEEFILYENYINNYPVVNKEEVVNKLNKTIYYLIKVDDIKKLSLNKVNLSLREKENNFEIYIFNINEVINKIRNYDSINIRNNYFKKELVDVLKYVIKNMEKNNIKVDLHTHTNYSDGELSPNDLINYAKENGIEVLAITDHDTLNGIKNISKNNSLKVINGIEFSCRTDKGRMHILGYNIDINNNELNKKINELRDNSLNTLLSLMVQLKIDYGIVFKYDDIKDLINSTHHLGRPDIAKLLMKYGYVKTVQEAFDKYLIKSYDKIRGSNKWLSYKEAIKLIKYSGGIPVLAHPKSLELSEADLLKLLKDMIKYGLMGIEVYHSSHTSEEIKLYDNIAYDLGLLVSGGSDYHGKIVKPNINIGKINDVGIKKKKLSILNKLI